MTWQPQQRLSINFFCIFAIEKYRATHCLFFRFIVHPRTDTPFLAMKEPRSAVRNQQRTPEDQYPPLSLGCSVHIPLFYDHLFQTNTQRNIRQEDTSMTHFFSTSLFLACIPRLSLNKGQCTFLFSQSRIGVMGGDGTRACARRCLRSKQYRCPSSVEHRR